MSELEGIQKQLTKLTIEVKLMKADIHWVKRILKWVVIGIAAVLGIQIPAWV